MLKKYYGYEQPMASGNEFKASLAWLVEHRYYANI